MLKVRIETKNAAFDQENLAQEIATCLNEVIDRIERGFKESGIYDSNGNNIGSFTLDNR